MESRTRIIPFQINEEVMVMVEAKTFGDEEDVFSRLLSF